MGRFDKFAKEAGDDVTPVPLEKKHIGRKSVKTPVKKPEAVPTKSIKIKELNYDQLGLLKAVGQGSYVELLDKAVTQYLEKFLKDNPQYQSMFSEIDQRAENPDQMSIEDYL